MSDVHGNPDPNVQHPVVIVDRQSKKVTYTGPYYYLAHFSKFVRPGDVRIESGKSSDGVRVLTFKKPNGDIVAELMNSKNDDVETSFRYHDQMLRVKLPAVSITTAIWNSTEKSKP